MAKGKKIKANMTEAEKKAILRAQKRAELEAKRKKQEVLKQYLKIKLEKEEKAGRENINKLNTQWRILMRDLKSKELMRDLNILQQTFDRVVDRKDNILKSLKQELQESEEQYMISLRNHLHNLDLLVELQNQRLERMKYGFDEELSMIKREFDAEKDFMSSKHQTQIDDLKDIYVAFDYHFLSKETDARNEYGSTRDELKNKSLEDKHTLRIALEKKVSILWSEYTQCQTNYNRATEERRALFEVLKARDEQSVIEIERQMIRLKEISAKIAATKAWRNKIQEEYEEKNNLLREEREKLGLHFLGLKKQINHLHEKQHVKLTRLAIETNNVRIKVDELNKQAEQIIAIGEDCRKLETEEEKVTPFYTSVLTRDEEENLTAQYESTKDENVKALLKRYAPLETFWRRFNKVQLDRLALLKEKDLLNSQNRNLKSLLAQYLDGLSVNDEILSKANSLLVINGNSNINPRPLVKDIRVRSVATVKLEAAHIYGSSVTSGLLQ